MPKSSASKDNKAEASNESPVGQYISANFLNKKVLSADELAKSLRTDTVQLDNIISGKRKLTPALALQLSDALGKDANFWLSLEADGELERLQGHYDKIKLGLDVAKAKLEDEKARQSAIKAEVDRILPFKDLRFYFLHIKKCAGTTLIGLADKQPHVNFYHPHANGNPILDDPELKGTARFLPFWDMQKSEQRKFLGRKTHNFIANEGHLGDYFEILDDMVYFTILRDPIKRTLSHFYHAKHLNAITEDLNLFVPERAIKVKWMNNFMIYQTTGKWVKDYDKEVTEAAIARLDKFDHVFLQEFLGDGLKHFEAYGWDLSELTNRNVRSKVSGKDEPNKETLAILAQLNQSDQKLYDHFRNKWETLSEV